jgi:hypothetical protein
VARFSFLYFYFSFIQGEMQNPDEVMWGRSYPLTPLDGFQKPSKPEERESYIFFVR